MTPLDFLILHIAIPFAKRRDDKSFCVALTVCFEKTHFSEKEIILNYVAPQK